MADTTFQRALRKYVFLQIPEAVLVSLVLMGLHRWEQISLATAALLAAGWVAKEMVMFPIVRKAYEPGPLHGTDALVGVEGIAADALTPAGPVRLGAELWNARLEDGSGCVDAGARVSVRRVDGFVLVVTPVEAVAPQKEGTG